MISSDGRRTLLLLARARIASQLAAETPIYPDRTTELSVHAGAFVTLRNRTAYPTLRGCIGRVEARESIYETILYVAGRAAFHDPRFAPIAPEEMDDLTIEISVLSAPVPVRNPGEIEVGVHGLIVSSRGDSGLLLPQVAPEQGWTRHQFLSGVCRKARLPEDAWKRDDVTLERFEALVFDELSERV